MITLPTNSRTIRVYPGNSNFLQFNPITKPIASLPGDVQIRRHYDITALEPRQALSRFKLIGAFSKCLPP